MRFIVITLLTVVALATSGSARAADVGGGGAGAFLADGDVVCGAIGDVTADTDTALFSYDPATGEPIRPAEVKIGGEVLPGSLFNDVLLGVMELHYIASTFEDQTAPEPFCVRVVMEGAVAVAVVPERASATACGRTMTYGMPVWLGIADVADDPAWSIALPGDLTGFDETTVGDPLNIVVAAGVFGKAFCAYGDAVSGEAYVIGVGDVTIASRTAEAITIAGMVPGNDSFRLTSGSSVDAALVPGTTACVEVRGYAGVDGRVEMRIVDDPSCVSGGGAGVTVLPDVAMEHAAPFEAGPTSLAGLLLVLAAAAAAVVARRRGHRAA